MNTSLARAFAALLAAVLIDSGRAEEVIASLPPSAGITRNARITIAGDLVDGVLVKRVGDDRSLVAQTGVSAQSGSFGIVIVPGPTLAANAPALAAFNRAAQQWAARISDPVTITVNADLAPLESGIIGSTSSVILTASYATIRNQVVADAVNETDDAIIASLPSSAQFTGVLKAGSSFSGNLIASKANLKALGFSGLDSQFGTSDGLITFSTNFNFDFDNSNGVTAGQMDFETVAAHEIGHLLGFFSDVDTSDAGVTTLEPTTLDLFRFRDGGANDPGNPAQFTTFPRDLVPGGTNDPITDEASSNPAFPERPMSKGLNSDGRQASHWKADELSGAFIGLMDPTLAFGQFYNPQNSDFRALDLIGYEIVSATPEIAVEQPPDTDLASGGSRSFGAVFVGGTADRAFTIKNTGSGDLNLTGTPKVALTGSSDFNVTAQPNSPIAGGGSSVTFTVRFTPTGSGLKNAQLSIANNDSDENPFTILLSGTAVSTGTFDFQTAVTSVNQGATQAVLTVTRAGADDAASVTVTTSDGAPSTVPPFAAAAAGVDYTALTTTLDFATGETSKTVNLTLLPQSGNAIPNKKLTVSLNNPTNFATLGATAMATVRILANDSAKPTLAVTAPSAAANLGAAAPYLVKGTAGDAKGIDRVEVALNGAAPVSAALGSATDPAKVPFSANIVPVPGPNTLVVTAFDLRGNSTSITREFNYTRRYVLTLNRGAPGGVDLDNAGTLSMAATPSANATSLAPITANANPRTSEVAPGTAVKVTAVSKSGYVFSHFAGLPGGAVATGNTATFTMPSADMSGLTANFVVNPFHGPVGAGNVYAGLIHPTGGAPSNNETEGYFTGTLTPSNGLFSGKVLIGGVSQSFLLYFYGDGTGLFNVGTTKQYALTFGGRSLSIYFNAGVISAYITNGGHVSAGTATRAIYSSTNKAPASLLNVPSMAGGSINKGLYTVAFPSAIQVPPLPLSTYPQGDGYGLITVSELGAVSLTGTLADGTAVSGSSVLLAGNTCPIFLQLTTPGQAPTVKGGSLGGVFTFSPTANSDITGAGFRWFRPTVTQASGSSASDLATQLYTTGWPNGISVSPWGALYDPAVTAKNALDLDTADALSFEDGKLAFANGKLAPAITKTDFIVSGNTITKTIPMDPSFSLGLTSASGAFSGKFSPNWAAPNSANPGFKGIVIQKGANRGGYGFFLSNAVGDLNPESGRVVLTVETHEDAKPPVTAATPATVVATWPYTIKGTAGNARGLDRVELVLNGGPPVTAVLGSASTSGSVPYSLAVEPVNGNNTLLITGYDLRGNATTITVNFHFTRRLVLTLARVVPAAVAATPDAAGTLALSATPASGATTLSPATANADPRTSTLVPGTAVKLTAMAKTGYVFSHWSGVPGGAVILGNVATFTPVANLTAITATFVANPFEPPAGAGKTFHGLIHPQNPTPSSNATEGFITGTLTSASGMFSGKVFIEGVAQMFGATFYGNGSSTFTVGSAKQTSLTFGGGKVLTLSYAAGAITATVTAGGNVSTGAATRAIYSSTNTVPAAFLNASATKGYYTVGFPAKTQTPPLPFSSYPQGDGFATLSLTHEGVVTLTGTLADGTAITGSSGLVTGNQCPIFIQLATPGSSALGGSLGGILTLDTAPANSDVSATNMLWFRPAVSGGTPATDLYTSGWPNGIRVNAVGARYNKALTLQAGLGLGAPSSPIGNAALELSAGKLTSPVLKTNFNISGSTITKMAPADMSYSLTAVAATGAFSGSFTPDWTPLAAMKPAFKGIVIQKGANKGGFGFFLSNTPGDSNPESGGVTLGAP